MDLPSEDTTNSLMNYDFSKCTIIGDGRIGHSFLEASGGHLVTRTQLIGCDIGPIIVCVRNQDLNLMIQQTPIERRSDLVFIQNGMIDPILLAAGLWESAGTHPADKGATRGVLYFAVQKKGDKPVDGGGTVFTGKYSKWMCSILAKMSISAREVDRTTFQIEMGKKLIWNCVFGLLGEIYHCSVDQLVDECRPEIESLVAELSSVYEECYQLKLGHSLMEMMIEYAHKVGFYQPRVSEWDYRNGWFFKMRETPFHADLRDRYLNRK